MGGHEARKGFRFQDLYLLLRVFRAAGEYLDSTWTVAADPASLLDTLQNEFGIEASRHQDEAGAEVVDWDVYVKTSSGCELIEVKSGAVEKHDRLAFWHRLRRELGSPGADSLFPILVVDPDIAGGVEKWRGLAQVALSRPHDAPVKAPEGNVMDATQLLAEAMWHICGSNEMISGVAPSTEAAQRALARFRLQEIRIHELEREVRALMEIVFPGGLNDTYEPLLLGWLTERATASDAARRLFCIRDLLAEVGVLDFARIFEPGKLALWRTLWLEVAEPVRARTRMRLGTAGRSLSPAEIQPGALAMLADPAVVALVVSGTGGAGKSTLLAQAVSAAAERDEMYVWCGADDVNIEEISELTNAFRFRASLVALRHPTAVIRLFVDGLDEAPAAKRERWGEQLARLPAISNARVVVSIREAIWRADGSLRQKIGTWKRVDLDLWPEPVVESLIAGTAYVGVLPRSVLQLVRTPIMLDLFWRTFVEGDKSDPTRAATLQSRHELIAAFWDERLLRSPRHVGHNNLAADLNGVTGDAAKVVGAFRAQGVDKSIFEILQAEGVIVPDGRLQPRFNFRHPLLRDFAFAQWCLSVDSAQTAADRWASISGGLQRFGALRAITEALCSAGASFDYHGLTLYGFIQAALGTGEATIAQIPQLFGSWDVTSQINPQGWPAALRARLPGSFATNVLLAARLNENHTWASTIANWPDVETWIDGTFPAELFRYIDWLRGKMKEEPARAHWAEAARSAAGKLRQLAESPRFRTEFAAADGWLTMQAIRSVTPVLPDEATLAWVERTLPGATWRTRSFALQELIHLAAVDAARSADLYRVAVGLTPDAQGFRLDRSRWAGLMPEQALDWSLDGKDHHRSLLREFPGAFFPVAVELAEALFRDKIGTPEDGASRLDELIKIFNPGSTEAACESGQPTDIGTLIDDLPQWGYWRNLAGADLRHRCVRAIHDHAQAIAERDPDFCVCTIVPVLRRARLGSIQSVALDILLVRRNHPGFPAELAKAAVDRRLYFMSGLDYWLAQNLAFSWPSLPETNRAAVQAIVAVLTHGHYRERALTLIAQIPEADLTPELALIRPGLENRPQLPRPVIDLEIDHDFGGAVMDADENEDTRAPGNWPDSIDQAMLLEFHLATFALSQTNVTAEVIAAERPRATSSAVRLLAALEQEVTPLHASENSWAWGALQKTLASFRAPAAPGTAALPPSELVQGCARLAMQFLPVVPSDLQGKLPEGEVWSGIPSTTWTRALELADEALTWEPSASDSALQSQLVAVLEAVFATNSPMLQLVSITEIRPWHWMKSPERRAMYRRLVWAETTDPVVLHWSLTSAMRLADEERTSVFRSALQRSDAGRTAELAHQLGQCVGAVGLVLFSPGRRSTAADLTREVIANPESFPLIRGDENRRAFWRGFAFGLKEHAKHAYANASLADDYGAWMLAAWRDLLPRRMKRNESEGVVLFAMHWIERKQPSQTDAPLLLPWWRSIRPLLMAVATEGGTPDCFNLLFNLRDGEFNFVASPDELLTLVEMWTDRIVDGAARGLLDIDERNPDREEHHTWRECSDYAASTVGALYDDARLSNDLLRDRAHRLLSKLAGAPLLSGRAAMVVHLLQKD